MRKYFGPPLLARHLDKIRYERGPRPDELVFRTDIFLKKNCSRAAGKGSKFDGVDLFAGTRFGLVGKVGWVKFLA